MLNYPVIWGQDKKTQITNFVTPKCENHIFTPTKTPIVANQAVIEFLYTNHPPQGVDIGLATVSERDSVWDTHRNQSAIVGEMYAQEKEYAKYGERIGGCSGYLKFGIGEHGLVLKQAFFCRVRYCTTCQWRKSLYWKAMMYQTYEQIKEQYPTHRFIFLTLTVKNPHITDLKSQLAIMNNAFKKLTKRKEFMAVVDGWIRTTEVTRPKDETSNSHAHPHFHCILMVKPSYFKGASYIKQSKWAELWQSCLQVDYLPQVDVRAVKPKKGKGADDDEAIKSAIVETLKYAVKPDDIIQDHDDPQAREWFYELTRQTHKLRFVATGGILKNALKPSDEIDNNDMIVTGNDDESQATDERRLNFTYYPVKQGYFYNPNYNE